MSTKTKSPKLSPNELAIMTALWDLEQATGKQLLEHVCPTPALTTLLTYLVRLQGKGFVRREPSPAGYVYMPAVPRTSVAMRMLDQVVAQFEGRLSGLVSCFVKTRKLSDEECQRIRAALDEMNADK